MKRTTTTFVLLLIAAAALAGIAPHAQAAGADPLFVNLTTKDAHRSAMALGMAASQLERGHPVTVFLNDEGVQLASAKGAAELQAQRKSLADLIGKGATVYACPFCLKHYGLQEADLLKGIVLSSPERLDAAIFKAGTQTLSW